MGIQLGVAILGYKGDLVSVMKNITAMREKKCIEERKVIGNMRITITIQLNKKIIISKFWLPSPDRLFQIKCLNPNENQINFLWQKYSQNLKTFHYPNRNRAPFDLCRSHVSLMIGKIYLITLRGFKQNAFKSNPTAFSKCNLFSNTEDLKQHEEHVS